MRVTMLGCGTSTGVPQLPGDWGACDPNEPKNRRRRVSILIEAGERTVLVDTGPDMRAQLLDAGVTRLDGVLITHDHADHTHGIDDLRGFYQHTREQIPLYTNAETLERLQARFDYIFRSRQGYPPICKAETIVPGMPVTIGDVTALPFWQEHGSVWSLGFRFGSIAYSTDVHWLPEESYRALEGVKVWIVDAVRYKPHPTHFCVEDALAAIQRVGCERAILTHMNKELDYTTLAAELPPGVEPGYDGLVIEAGE